MYNIEKMVDAIVLQLKVICSIVGIEPTLMPNEEGYVAPTIEELTDPDA
jgi:hypothetical protein